MHYIILPSFSTDDIYSLPSIIWKWLLFLVLLVRKLRKIRYFYQFCRYQIVESGYLISFILTHYSSDLKSRYMNYGDFSYSRFA